MLLILSAATGTETLLVSPLCGIQDLSETGNRAQFWQRRNQTLSLCAKRLRKEQGAGNAGVMALHAGSISNLCCLTPIKEISLKNTAEKFYLDLWLQNVTCGDKCMYMKKRSITQHTSIRRDAEKKKLG